MEDQKIIELYWSRNEEAIRQTADRYGQYCYAIAYNILSVREDSEECVNDTYLDAWKSMPPHKPTVLSAFLGKITRRIAIDRWRQAHAQKRGGGEYDLSLSELEQSLPGGNTTEQIADGNALSQAIAEFLKTRPEVARRAFICRYFYMDSLKETAKACGLTESNTKVLLHRTRLALREYLEKEGYL